MGWKSHVSWVYISNLKKIQLKTRFSWDYISPPPRLRKNIDLPNVLKSSTNYELINYFSHYTYHCMFFNFKMTESSTSYKWFIWPLKNTIRIIWVIKRKKKNSFVFIISHTDANHTDTATFPTKDTYTYIKNVKKKSFFCPKSRSLSSAPITWQVRHSMRHSPREKAPKFK